MLNSNSSQGLGDLVQRKKEAYQDNPQGLQQRYKQSQQLTDLLALQQLKSEKEAAARNIQLQMDQNPNTIAQQRETQVLDLIKNNQNRNLGDVSKGVAGVLGQKQKVAASKQAGMGIIPPNTGGAPTGAPTGAPAGAPKAMMAEGGIIGFKKGSKVTDSFLKAKKLTRAEFEAMTPASQEQVERLYLHSLNLGAGALDTTSSKTTLTPEEKVEEEARITAAAAAEEEAEEARIAAKPSALPTPPAPVDAPPAPPASPASDPGVMLRDSGVAGDREAEAQRIAGAEAAAAAEAQAQANKPSSILAGQISKNLTEPPNMGITTKLPGLVTPGLKTGLAALQGTVPEGGIDPRVAARSRTFNSMDRANGIKMYERNLREQKALDLKQSDPAELRRQQRMAGYLSAGSGPLARAGAASFNTRMQQDQNERDRLKSRFGIEKETAKFKKETGAEGETAFRATDKNIRDDRALAMKIYADFSVQERQSADKSMTREFDKAKNDKTHWINTLIAATQAETAQLNRIEQQLNRKEISKDRAIKSYQDALVRAQNGKVAAYAAAEKGNAELESLRQRRGVLSADPSLGQQEEVKLIDKEIAKALINVTKAADQIGFETIIEDLQAKLDGLQGFNVSGAGGAGGTGGAGGGRAATQQVEDLLGVDL